MPDKDQTILKSPSGGTGVDDETAVTAISKGINYIIAIGIDKYNCPEVNDFVFENCKKDCRDFTDTLILNYRGFQIYKNLLLDEAATQTNILDTIELFVKDEKDCNNINNNLIIYFSGHGDEVAQGFNKMGCWIPNGCKRFDYGEVLPYDKITPLLKQLKTQNFLLISDSCKSGQIFNEIQVGNQIADARTFNGKEISRWAIVSSRSNELSKAGGRNENSKFTEGLLKILRDNREKELHVTGIIAKLDQYFSSDEENKSFSGRLQFQNIPNSGQFVLKINEDRFEQEKKSEILETGFKVFNYDLQKPLFKKFASDEQKQIFLFTGTPFCGLHLLSYKAKISRHFPKKYFRTWPLSLANVSGSGENIVLNIFNAALRIEFNSLNNLTEYLRNKLDTECILFEFLYYNQQVENCIRPKDKIALLSQVAKFINTINETVPKGKKVFVFIIDEECVDYEKICNAENIAGVNTVYMPRVKPLQIEEAEDWYDNLRDQNSDEDRDAFDNYFNDKVFSNLKTFILETEGRPGSTIRKICSAVQCDDLADKILSPQQ